MKALRPTACLVLAAGLLATTGSLWAQTADADNAASKKAYTHKLTLGDRLRVSVFGEDDLMVVTRVDARGRINLNLAGEVVVGGLTLEQAKAAIEGAYKDGRYLRNPQVTLNVEDYASREVSVNGQVKQPGRIVLPIESTYTLAELITKVGGFTDIGKGTEVKVTRKLPDGTTKVFIVDVQSIISGKKKAKSADDLLLEPGDYVYVPERLI